MNARSPFHRAWVRNTLAAYALGLGLLHPVIAHGFTGPHGKELAGPQLVMHSVSLVVFGLFLCLAQNRALRLVESERRPLQGWPAFLLLPAAFWSGYYALYIPFDILFMLLFVGVIHAVQLRRFAREPRKWAWQVTLAMLAGATAGISGGVLMYYSVAKHQTGLGGDLLMWLAISIPAALVSAPLAGAFLRAPLSEPQAMNSAPRGFMLGIQDSMQADWLAETPPAGGDRSR